MEDVPVPAQQRYQAHADAARTAGGPGGEDAAFLRLPVRDDVQARSLCPVESKEQPDTDIMFQPIEPGREFGEYLHLAGEVCGVDGLPGRLGRIRVRGVDDADGAAGEQGQRHGHLLCMFSRGMPQSTGLAVKGACGPGVLHESRVHEPAGWHAPAEDVLPVRAGRSAGGMGRTLFLFLRGGCRAIILRTQLRRMDGEPDAGLAGLQYTVAYMLGQQKTLAAFQSYFTIIGKAQPGGAFQQQDPFVLFLIVPLAFRRHMAPGDDALHQQAAVRGEQGREMFRRAGKMDVFRQREQRIHDASTK